MIDEIVKDYNNKISILKLSKKYGYSEFIIKKILKEKGIYNINKIFNPKLGIGKVDSDLETEILKEYNKDPTISVSKLSLKLNISTYLIDKVLFKNNITKFNPKTPIDINIRNSLIKDYNSKKYRTKDLLKKYNISNGFLYKALKKFKNPPVNKIKNKVGRQFKGVDNDSLIKDYLTGLSNKEITLKYNISVPYIYKLLKERKVKVIASTKKVYSQKEIKDMIKMYEAKIELKVIADKYTISKHTIYRIIKKANKLKITQLDKLNSNISNISKIIKAYKQNKSVIYIYKKFDICSHILYNILKENNIPLRHVLLKNKFSNKQIQEIILLYKQNESVNNIYITFNIHSSQLYKILKQNNIALRNKRKNN